MEPINYQMIPAGFFNVWITALLPDYESKLTIGLLKKGYTIATASADFTITYHRKDKPSALIVFSLYSGKKDINPMMVQNDLSEIVDREKMMVYSTIVTVQVSSAWSDSNISMGSNQIVLPPLPMTDINKKLN
jgi:hypothetical protein